MFNCAPMFGDKASVIDINELLTRVMISPSVRVKMAVPLTLPIATGIPILVEG